MDIVVRAIFILAISVNMLLSIDMQEISKSVSKDFKPSTQTKQNKTNIENIDGKQDDFLDILSKEVWSSFDINVPTTIHSQNLKKILKTKKVSYMQSAKSYTGVIDYVDNMIRKEFTNYMTWVIVIQSFVIILFIILYTDMNYKIKKLSLYKHQEKSEQDISIKKVSSISKAQINENRENLRKIFL